MTMPESTGGNQAALSAEVFIIPVEPGRYLVYAPLRRSAFVGSAGAVNLLADLKESAPWPAGPGSLAALRFFREMGLVDSGPESPPSPDPDSLPRPTSITLFLTTACNLRCTYCYASAGEGPAKFMSLETARNGIDFIVRNAIEVGSKEIQVGYHGGGEPTLHWPLMQASLGYAREKAAAHGLSVSASTATNGVLSDAQIDWLVANFQSATVSFDGLPALQDRNRVTPSGAGSSGRVMQTMRRFDAAGFRYGVRLTVTADGIGVLPESVEFVCRNFKPNGVQAEPAYQLGRGVGGAETETEAFIAAFRQARARAHCLGAELSYSGARMDFVTNHFCSAARDSFCLSPDGNVSCCFEVFSEDTPLAGRFFYGRPARGGGFDLDLSVLRGLRSLGVADREFCRGCFARWTCAGDCLHKALTSYPDGEFAGTSRCRITQALTADLILERIAQSGGVFWHEGDSPGVSSSTLPEVPDAAKPAAI